MPDASGLAAGKIVSAGLPTWHSFSCWRFSWWRIAPLAMEGEVTKFEHRTAPIKEMRIRDDDKR